MDLKNKNSRMVLSALFLATAMVLPLITGQIPTIGKALCPMHFPVFLCAFFCGPWYALAAGFIAPLLRFLIFGMPAIVPTGIVMSFELASYGFFCGLIYSHLPKKRASVYISLISAMLMGRIVWGAGRAIMFGLGKSEFGWAAFIAGGFVNALPGIIAQLIVIPVIVCSFQNSKAEL